DITLITPEPSRIERLSEPEACSENHENGRALSIKVALDALGYDSSDFANRCDAHSTTAVTACQEYKTFCADGSGTGETTTSLISDIRELIQEEDAQLNYLVDYINNDRSIMEIEQIARNNAQHIPVVEDTENNLEDTEADK